MTITQLYIALSFVSIAFIWSLALFAVMWRKVFGLQIQVEANHRHLKKSDKRIDKLHCCMGIKKHIEDSETAETREERLLESAINDARECAKLGGRYYVYKYQEEGYFAVYNLDELRQHGLSPDSGSIVYRTP